jgi:hypothetical protein
MLPSLHDLEGFVEWMFVGSTQVAAWGGVLSLLILYYYTRYTRRMMVATEATMRASQRPLVQVIGVERFGEEVEVKLRNVGHGPALNLCRWIAQRSTVANGIPRRPGFIAPPRHFEENSHVEVLGAGGEETIDFDHRMAEGKDWEEVLLIIHAEDIQGNRYQNAVKIRLGSEENRMVWQSMSEQLQEDAMEHPLVQKLMGFKSNIQERMKR